MMKLFNPEAIELIKNKILQYEEHVDFSSNIVLSESLNNAINNIAMQYYHRDYINSMGLKSIRKLIFAGGAGACKIEVAEAIAHAANLPIVRMQYFVDDEILKLVDLDVILETLKNYDKKPFLFILDLRRLFDFGGGDGIKPNIDASKLVIGLNEIYESLDGMLVVIIESISMLSDVASQSFDQLYNIPYPHVSEIESIVRGVLKTKKIDDSLDWIDILNRLKYRPTRTINRIANMVGVNASYGTDSIITQETFNTVLSSIVK